MSRSPKICDGFAPSPHELAATNACVPIALYRQVHAGEGRGGGRSPARVRPLSLALSAHTLAGEFKRISYVSRGKCTGEREPNAQLLSWRFSLVYPANGMRCTFVSVLRLTLCTTLSDRSYFPSQRSNFRGRRTACK